VAGVLVLLNVLGVLSQITSTFCQITDRCPNQKVAGPSPSSTPTATSTVAPTPTPGLSSTPTPAPTPMPTPVAPPTPAPPSVMAFMGSWKYPYYELLQMQQIGGSVATATLLYAPDGGVYTQTAEVVFSSQSGNTLTGTVAKVYPQTYLFNVGDPVAVTLIDGTKLQVSVGQNNPASRVLARN
jgi:hypothetical protein